MTNRRFIFSCCCLLCAIAVVAQGRSDKWLWKRITYLRDSASSMLPAEKLAELLQYESGIINKSRSDSLHTLLLQRIGAAFSTLGYFDSAQKYTNQSINLIYNNPKITFTDRNCLLKDYSNLSRFYDSLNNWKAKKMATDSTIAIARTLGVFKEEYLMALIDKVADLYYTGDYILCFDYATSGELANRNYEGANKIDYQTYFLSWIVNAIIVSKDPGQYDRAEAILASSLKTNKAAGKKTYLGTIYELLAEIMIEKGELEPALRYFRQALINEKQYGTKSGCVVIFCNIAYKYYYKYLKDYKKALNTYRQALQYIKDNDSPDALDNSDRLNVLANIAMVFVKKGCYDSASYYFHLAYDKISGAEKNRLPVSIDDSFFDNINIKYFIELLINHGDAFSAFYKLEKRPAYLKDAIAKYKFADKLLDKFKPKLYEMGSKLFWRQKSRSLYEHAIEACYYLNKPTEAFYFFEKSRAVILSDQLSERNMLGKDDIFMLGQLKRKITKEENNLLGNEKDSSNLKSYNTLLNDKQRLYDLEQGIKAHNPLYYQNFIDTSFITVRDVQEKILKDHNALVEIFTGDSAVYTMVVKKKGYSFSKIDKIDFDSTALLFKSFISNPRLLEEKFPDFVKTSSHLFDIIFQKNNLPEGRIIISPDGRYFPFEALVTNSQGSNVNYFLEKHAVSYTYSARYLLNQFNSASDSGARDFLGVAPGQYHYNQKLAPLPESGVFLKGLQKYFRDADLLLDGKASKNNFLEMFCRYKIVQLYTHASANQNGAEPSIYLADSILYLSDLVTNKKNATSLVVLSACETGTGKDYIGEGVFSFNRGFAAMGIPSSVINLWAVDNESTIKITDFFYKYLNKGLPLDVALQKAKLEFLHSSSRRTELPYYWSGAILAGKTDAIATGKPVPWLIISVIAMVSLIPVFSTIIIRKIKRKAG